MVLALLFLCRPEVLAGTPAITLDTLDEAGLPGAGAFCSKAFTQTEENVFAYSGAANSVLNSGHL